MGPVNAPASGSSASARAPWLRIAAARTLQALGWPGVVGLALLLVAATLVAAAGLRARAETQDTATELALPPGATIAPLPPGAAPRPDAAPPDTLPAPTDIPALMLQIARIAVEQGVGWPQADYRTVDGGDEHTARLEIRCTLKAPYPALRRFLAGVLQQLPALTLREFSMSRATSDTVDVEAKLTLVVLLDEASSATTAVEPSR